MMTGLLGGKRSGGQYQYSQQDGTKHVSIGHGLFSCQPMLSDSHGGNLPDPYGQFNEKLSRSLKSNRGSADV
jgi:hypothetical protein